MTQTARWSWWILIAALLAAAALAPILGHAYLGTFSRYLADDFCTAATLRRLGFIASQVNWYQTWSGRYAYTFVVTLTQAIGPALTPWLPAIALAAWIGAIVVAARRFGRPMVGWVVALALAGVHVFATLEGSPSVYQSLYWQTGMVTYTLPLVLGVYYGVWLVWVMGEGRPRHLLAAGATSLVFAFVLGGFSETYVALQTTALVLLLLAVPWLLAGPARRRAAAIAGAGLAGSLAAAMTIALAPGTQVRRGLMPASPTLGAWTEAVFKDGYLFLARTVKDSPGAILLALAVPCLFLLLAGLDRRDAQPGVDGGRRGRLFLLILLPIATPMLMLATIAPYELAVSSYPDARVLITPMFVLVSGLMLWAGTLGLHLASVAGARATWTRRIAVLLAAAVAVVGLAVTVPATRAILGGAEAARAYAESWDTRDLALRQAVGQPGPVAAASLRHMGGLAEIGRDPQEWINLCVAWTYGVESVVAK